MVEPGCLTKTENSLLEGRKHLAKQDKEIITQKTQLLVNYLSIIREKLQNQKSITGKEKIENIMIHTQDSLPKLAKAGEFPGLGTGRDRIKMIQEVEEESGTMKIISYVSLSLSGVLIVSGLVYVVGKVIWKNYVLT